MIYFNCISLNVESIRIDERIIRRTILQVFPDGCVKKEIQSLMVHCLHIVHGCEWEGKITNLEVSQSTVTGWTIVPIKT